MVSAKVQLLGALATGVLATITAPTCSTCTISNGDAGCQSLQEAFPGMTFLPGHEVYDYEKTNFWSNHQILSPKCIFRPQSALDVAEAVVALKEDCTPFAVRGGGHMGIKGANSIDNGVLIVMSNLTTLVVSKDRQTVDLGPGHDWGHVYTELDKHGLAVSGGRLSPVGVPGLLLAGGVNFHGNQHGWAADNVLEYEVVLASGEIVTVSATEEPDLFWALKGGSSNFGIVTKFKLRAFESGTDGKVLAGTYTVAAKHLDAFFAAIAHYAAYNTDPLSHIVPMTVAGGPDPSTPAAAAVIMYYDAADVAQPECFAEFFAIPALANSVSVKTLGEFALETGGLVVDGINNMFIAGTTVGKTYEDLLRGIKITNDVFFSRIAALHAVIPAAQLSLVSIDWQPLGALWAAGSARSNPGGNPLGLDVASKGTYLAWAEVVEWTDGGGEYYDAVHAWVVETTRAIEQATRDAGLYDAFNYMGDAAGFQSVYPGYGADNEARLRSVSRRYDPERVFQRLMPGGFKIGA
ncbi:prosolanapyrone-II oxidase [Microdochium nivale]|nr:prosolanapyrone-II oxidase [Microdochium nivale]